MKKPAPKAPVKGHGGGGAAGHGGAAAGGGAAKSPAAGKHQAKAKAKPAKVSRAVHRARRQAALRGAATRKQHAAQAKKRGLALGSAVACCSAEALAASLRLTGWPVSDADVLALYWHTARDEHAGASIVATLEAAARWGLAGAHLVAAAPVPVLSIPADLERPGPDGAVPVISGAEQHPVIRTATGDDALDGQPGFPGVVPGALLGQGLPCHQASVILGVDLPGPHAVLDTGSEWISWGQPWAMSDFPDVVLEEAWEVTWPS